MSAGRHATIFLVHQGRGVGLRKAGHLWPQLGGALPSLTKSLMFKSTGINIACFVDSKQSALTDPIIPLPMF